MHPNPFGLACSHSPVDLPEPLLREPNPLKWVSTVIGTAALVLLLFNAHAVRGWAYQLPPGFWSEQAVAAAEGWYGLVDQVGLNRPFGTMHGFWRAARQEDQPSPADSSTRSARANSSSARG